jgi:hypothetical protein
MAPCRVADARTFTTTEEETHCAHTPPAKARTHGNGTYDENKNAARRKPRAAGSTARTLESSNPAPGAERAIAPTSAPTQASTSTSSTGGTGTSRCTGPSPSTPNSAAAAHKRTSAASSLPAGRGRWRSLSSRIAHDHSCDRGDSEPSEAQTPREEQSSAVEPTRGSWRARRRMRSVIHPAPRTNEQKPSRNKQQRRRNSV